MKNTKIKLLIPGVIVIALHSLSLPYAKSEPLQQTIQDKTAANITTEKKADKLKVISPPEKNNISDNSTVKVNVNTATAEQLAKALHGIGIKKAEAIVNYREQYGVFTSLEQLKEVPGIGPVFLERNLFRMTL